MKKDFDTVELQREIREKLQKEFEDKPELRRKKLLEIQAKYGIVVSKKSKNAMASQ